MPKIAHQLAAIIFADVVGYTAMMQKDENDAVEKITRFRQSIESITEELNGKIVQYYGDGALLLFHSATDAVESAKALQIEIHEPPIIPVRIGIHMGDVLLQDENVFGDVVNIASRIQAQAPPGGIFISAMVYQNIANKKGLEANFVKEEKLKNVSDPVGIYEVLTHLQPLVKPAAITKTVSKTIEENSIAVLPFNNLSSHQEQEYFSDGLTEDIITQLSKIGSLKVISRTSVMQYKTQPKPVKQIGKELGVAYILEGSVQRSTDTVRITAQLINATTDEHIWADSYDQPLKDIFSIQREVALSIATVLNKKLSKKESKNLAATPTADMQAYDLYLRGKFLLDKRNKTDLLIARELFQQAIKKDTAFVLAYAGLAHSYLLSSFRGYEDPAKMLPLAKKQIDKAMEIDGNAGEIFAALGYWHHQMFQWKAAEKAYRKAIQLNESQSNVYLWLAILLEGKGEKEQVAAMYEKGIALNPEWDYLMQNHVIFLANTGYREEAIALQNKLIDKATLDLAVKKERYANLSRLYWSFNEKEEAIRYAKKAKDNGLIQFFSEGDNSILENAENEKFNVLKKSGAYVSSLWQGIAFAKAGAKDKALQCFWEAIDKKEPGISYLLIGQYEYLNLKYLNFIKLRRMIKTLIQY